jgi:hypothetical protein
VKNITSQPYLTQFNAYHDIEMIINPAGTGAQPDTHGVAQSESTLSVATNFGEKQEPSPMDQSEVSRSATEKEVSVDPERAQDVPTASPVVSMPPDGGLQAWLVVAGGFCSLFVSFGWINCSSSHYSKALLST